MIELVFAICTTAALDHCTITRRLVMPMDTTMESCTKVRHMLLNDEAGVLIIPDGFNKVECEKH